MIPLFTSGQVREADKYAIEQLRISGVVLMENASRSIVEAVFEKFKDINIFDEIISELHRFLKSYNYLNSIQYA